MQGQRANIVLFETLDLPDLSYSSDVVSQIENKREEVTEIFKSELEKDWQLNLTQLNRIIDQTEVAFSENSLQKTFPTFDKTMLQALEKQTGKSPKEASFAEVLLLLQEIENPTYYITEKQINDKQKELQFTLFKPTKIIFQSQNPIEVLNEFQKIFTHSYYFETEKNEALKKVETKIKQTQQYLKKIEGKLWELIGTVSYQEIADIIMANLHSLPSEAQRISQIVELFDFYHNTTITIKLKEHLTPQKTAESYYRKAKNQKIEIDRIEQNITQKKQLLTELVENAKQIALATDFKDMRSYLQEKDLDNKKEDIELHLFKKFTHEGFEIWIGKNAQNNDLLTQRYAYKEDLWLHARDVTGSHVIIKYQAGKVFPNSVIERAAQLAAYFSKRKNDTLCPVSYTPKKYVRKPKGAKDGSVKIEREDVIMVRPMIEER
jgi:predicted ribosome quality control (RQC) complex YloA/Tae2 family protein